MPRKQKQATFTPVPDLISDPQIPASETDFPDLDDAWLGRVREKLAAWYQSVGRSLPWREDRDPYRILVSEMMLVQTTVAAVVPFFGRFLDRFPDVEALAVADEADVLKAWEGLGYYRRARQLQAAARAIMSEHGGAFPRNPEAIRALPGVGRYIAGAVRSFAFDQSAPIVEANTQRVLARWLAWPEEPSSTRSQARLWEAAARLVPETGAGEFNQAFMELGALVCVPKAPLCLACPVAGDCQARRLGRQDRLPVARPKPPPKDVAEACALIRRDDRYLILKRGAGRLWEHFWEFPTLHVGGADPAGRSLGAEMALAEGFERLTGVRAELGPAATSIRFGVTTHRVALDVHRGDWLEGEAKVRPGWVEAAWVAARSLGDYTLGSATRRIVAWLLANPGDTETNPPGDNLSG